MEVGLLVLRAVVGVIVAGQAIGPGERSLDHALGIELDGIGWPAGPRPAGA